MHTTAQIPETLRVDEEVLLMRSTPLEPWLEQQQLVLCSERVSPSCVRRYVAQWELQRGRLYLTEVRPFGGHAFVRRRGGYATSELSLKGLFPKAQGPVCADWFSGQLRCPTGPVAKDRDAGDDGVYSQDMLVDIEAGHVVRIAFRHNDGEPLRVLAHGQDMPLSAAA
ncbi:MAG TPA: hypothetical protein VGQ23_16555 [Burkholderiaceae bacterium]|jgi:hypothetical protein|nr:hypothetical protein [Burkholderiaceae bacterium]